MAQLCSSFPTFPTGLFHTFNDRADSKPSIHSLNDSSQPIFAENRPFQNIHNEPKISKGVSLHLHRFVVFFEGTAQLMVNCWFGLVVWIPRIPFMKGIVTWVYP